MEIQRQIRENNLEVQNFLQDLEQWEKSIKRGSSTKRKQENTAPPPVRQVPGQTSESELFIDQRDKSKTKSLDASLGKLNDSDSEKKNFGSCNRTTKASHTYDYYNEWDKVNIDALLESSSEDEEDKPAARSSESLDSSNEQGRQREKESAFRKHTNSLERVDANELKERGNEAFRSGEYLKAINFYEKSNEAVPSHVTLSNLSMALLKAGNYERAEKIASNVLEIDPENVKALGRRAAARVKQTNLLEAAKDYERALLLEPTNSECFRAYTNLVKRILAMNDLEIPSMTRPVAVSRENDQPLCSSANAHCKEHYNSEIAGADDQIDAEENIKPEDRNTLTQLSSNHRGYWMKNQPKSSMVFETFWKECGPDVSKRAGLLASIQDDRLKDLLLVGISAQFLFEAGEAALCALPTTTALRVLKSVSKVSRFSLIVFGMKREHRNLLSSYAACFITAVENEDEMAKFIELRSIWNF